MQYLLLLVLFLFVPATLAEEIPIEEDMLRNVEARYLLEGTIQRVYKDSITGDNIIVLCIEGYTAEEIDPDLSNLTLARLYLLADDINVHFVMSVSVYMIYTESELDLRTSLRGVMGVGYLERFFGALPEPDGLEVKIVLM